MALIEPQVRFAAQALEAGFAVFLPDSSDRVTDDAGRLCGKVWDDEPRTRPNVDLPFIGALLAERIAALRPAGSASAQFVVGHSSGGFMAVRAARRFGDRIAAFASVAGGDPYGWYRDCTPRPTDRPNVFGGGFDRETRRQIVEPGACDAEAYPQEQRWDDNPAVARPPFRVLHHEQDGILDRSCVDKQRSQLRAHGHLEHAPLTVQGGPRSADVHYWLDAYNAPLIDYFARGHSVRGSGAP